MNTDEWQRCNSMYCTLSTYIGVYRDLSETSSAFMHDILCFQYIMSKYHCDIYDLEFSIFILINLLLQKHYVEFKCDQLWEILFFLL